MKWHVRAALILMYKILPRYLEEKTYYCMQRKFGKLQKIDVEKRWTGINDIFVLAQKYNIPEEADIFEIGTGRYPLFPLIFYCMGARSITSCDVANLLRLDLINEMIKSFKTCSDMISSELELIAERTKEIQEVERIGDFFKMINGTYRAPVDAADTKYPAGSFDIVYSNAVLEHVEKKDIIGIHKESYRILKEEGWILHNIDLSDHFSHSDKQLSKVNFLRFGEGMWDFLVKNTFFYQNRLRASEHMELLERCGFETVETKAAIDPSDVTAVENLRIADGFRNFSKEDLATTRLLLLSRKK